MKIEFEHPLHFCLDVIEIDDHVPSMRVEAKIVVTQFQHTFRYAGMFWIACENWDIFKDALRSSLEKNAVLQDMNGYFTLSVSSKAEGLWLSWEFTKDDLGGGKKTKVSFSSEIDDDMFSKIKSQFLEFPAWW